MFKFLIIPFFPTVNWTGKERVYAITGLKYKEYISITGFHEVPNSSDTPADKFIVLSKDLKNVLKSLPRNHQIVGFAHTHPDNSPKPSIEDKNGIGEGLFGVVICNNQLSWYTREGNFKPKELG